ncbi:Serine/threonine-protein kinase B [Stieleria maiorica]|uniref:Serine/threonine-protein kinase B n=1 Tax=Stieleria maiorica TaxID=2795974 RepID=A0A5B9MIF4_9BACT|nr:molybdopterin-dependent oxidoreductase [Stieleria maiorica]QEF99395.1 Serine/threonine-protein kinase B [Stieleria maiorica]
MTSPPLPPNQQLVKRHCWPVVGERAPSQTTTPWTVTLAGEVKVDRHWSLNDLAALPQTTRRIDVHCVTRWSRLQMEFRGIRFAELVTDAGGEPLYKPQARFVSFVARSERSHSTSLPLRELLDLDPLVALRADGAPLPIEHGGPVRMVVPGKYFYKSIKWLERIEFLTDDRLGYWESEAGYHNGADPWKEQRYIASSLSKQDAARLIRQRDFRARDLLGLQANGMELANLNAVNARLRNADFRNTSLHGADFRGANLSNAHLESADLREANFRGADLEGADFSAADLRGADLRDASLFGASFAVIDTDGNRNNVASIDQSTKVTATSLDALTPEQRDCFRSQSASVEER